MVFDPSNIVGAALYFLVFAALAIAVTRLIHAFTQRLLKSTTFERVGDPTTLVFVSQIAQGAVYLLAFVLYAHIIPALRAMGTALLASASVITVILGFAAQNTLANFIAGVALLIYRPFRLGDHVQITTPNGAQTGIVRSLSLGYTLIGTEDQQEIIVPNTVMNSQVIVRVVAAESASEKADIKKTQV